MTWIYIAYLAALLYVSTNRQRFGHPGSLRLAWLYYAAIGFSHFFFTLFRAGNFSDSRDLALVEIWSEGVQWLLLGISLVYLAGTVAPPRDDAAVSTPPSPPV